MAKAKDNKPTVKAPKTVKVSTLVKAGLVAVAIIAAFIAGAATTNAYKATVHAEAQAIVTDLKSQQ